MPTGVLLLAGLTSAGVAGSQLLHPSRKMITDTRNQRRHQLQQAAGGGTSSIGADRSLAARAGPPAFH